MCISCRPGTQKNACACTLVGEVGCALGAWPPCAPDREVTCTGEVGCDLGASLMSVFQGVGFAGHSGFVFGNALVHP